MTCAQDLTQLLMSLPHTSFKMKVGTMKSAPTNAVRRSASWCAIKFIPMPICAYHTNANLACPALWIVKSVSPTKSPSWTLFTRIHILPLSIPESTATEEAPGCRQIILSLAPGLVTMTIQMDSFRTAMSCLLRCPTVWSLISSRQVNLPQILMPLGSTEEAALIPISFLQHSEVVITFPVTETRTFTLPGFTRLGSLVALTVQLFHQDSMTSER